MRFELRHALPRSCDVAWDALFGAEYDQAVQARASHDREILEEGPRGGKFYRRVRITQHKELPRFMKKAIGSDRLSYELEQWRDDQRHELKWKVTPPTAPDKIKAEGTYRLVATPGGCERLVNGEIKVSIPIVGGKIEKVIGEELRASYEDTAEFAREWLRTRTTREGTT